MKKLLAMALVVAMASGAQALDTPNMVGLFWAPGGLAGDVPVAFTDAETNTVFTGAWVNLWLVLLNPVEDIQQVKTFRGSIRTLGDVDGELIWGLEEARFNGAISHNNSDYPYMINFSILYINGFVPADPNGTLLARFRLRCFETYPIEFQMNGYQPTQGPRDISPRVFNFADELFYLSLTCDSELVDPLGWGTVATANGDGVIATEDLTLSNVKALFR